MLARISARVPTKSIEDWHGAGGPFLAHAERRQRAGPRCLHTSGCGVKRVAAVSAWLPREKRHALRFFPTADLGVRDAEISAHAGVSANDYSTIMTLYRKQRLLPPR